MNHITTSKTLQGTRGIVLDGRRTLAAARLGWGVLVGLSLILFALSVPARYEDLVELARQAEARIGPGGGLLHSFLSEGVYAFGVCHLRSLSCSPWRWPPPSWYGAITRIGARFSSPRRS